MYSNTVVSVQRALSVLPEELLQHVYDATGLRKAAVLGPRVLQQHVPVSTALQEQTAAEQSVVAHFCLTDEALQVVHVLNGLKFKVLQDLAEKERVKALSSIEEGLDPVIAEPVTDFIGECRWAGGAVDDQTGVRVL